MPHARRRYTWLSRIEEARDAEYVAAQVARVLHDRMDRWPKIFSDPEITGFSLGVLEFSVTITNKDRWSVSASATRLLKRLRSLTEVPLEQTRETDLELPKVHDHRSNAWLDAHSDLPAYTVCSNGHRRPRGVKCRLCATKPRRKVQTPWPAAPSV